MPACEECGEELLPHERECCEACDRDYYGRVVAWARGAEDYDLSLAYDGVRPSIH